MSLYPKPCTNFTDRRTDATPDELWLVQHQPVFTQGQAGKAEHLLMPGDIPVVQSDRGGQVTYHGPGQQVMYVMVDLKRNKIGVRQLVTAIEDTVINTLAHFRIESRAPPGRARCLRGGSKKSVRWVCGSAKAVHSTAWH
ncbi:Octanoyltransferase [Serratia plymuthica]|nr:Octanoyltransferase [Serratia plymuthica]